MFVSVGSRSSYLLLSEPPELFFDLWFEFPFELLFESYFAAPLELLIFGSIVARIWLRCVAQPLIAKK